MENEGEFNEKEEKDLKTRRKRRRIQQKRWQNTYHSWISILDLLSINVSASTIDRIHEQQMRKFQTEWDRTKWEKIRGKVLP